MPRNRFPLYFAGAPGVGDPEHAVAQVRDLAHAERVAQRIHGEAIEHSPQRTVTVWRAHDPATGCALDFYLFGLGPKGALPA